MNESACCPKLGLQHLPYSYGHPGTRRLWTRLQSQSIWASRGAHYRHKPGRTKPDEIQYSWLTGELQVSKSCSGILLLPDWLDWSRQDGTGINLSLPEGRGGTQCEELSLARVPSMGVLSPSLLRRPTCPKTTGDSSPQPCDLKGLSGEALEDLQSPCDVTLLSRNV